MKKLIVILAVQMLAAQIAATSFGAANADANASTNGLRGDLIQVVRDFQNSHSAEDVSRAEYIVTNALAGCEQSFNNCNEVIENVLSGLDVEISKGSFSSNLKGQITAIFWGAHEAVNSHGAVTYGGVERSLTHDGNYRSRYVVLGGVERGR